MRWLFAVVVTVLMVGVLAPRPSAQPPIHTVVLWQDVPGPALHGYVSLVRTENRCFLWFQGTPGWNGEISGGSLIETACPIQGPYLDFHGDPIPQLR